jgi:hypothetical protein
MVTALALNLKDTGSLLLCGHIDFESNRSYLHIKDSFDCIWLLACALERRIRSPFTASLLCIGARDS